MSIHYRQLILLRDLDKLAEEIKQYSDSTKLWVVLPGTTNSPCNLTLHLIGNLRHFVGSVIGKSGYIRNREAEFNMKNIDLKELLNLIAICKAEVEEGLKHLKQDDLILEFPVEVSSKKSPTGYVMLHLISHFNYHLGQINYHRRFFSSVKTEL